MNSQIQYNNSVILFKANENERKTLYKDLTEYFWENGSTSPGDNFLNGQRKTQVTRFWPANTGF